MITAPARMVAATSQHHAPRWRVTTSDGQDWTPALIEGSITKSSGRAPRTRATFTLATRGVPTLLDPGLLPTGRNIQLHYRIAPWADEILVATGRLVANNLTRPGSVWVAHVADWSSVVALDDTDPTQWSGMPATVSILVQQIVNRTLPGTTFSITGPATTAPVPSDLVLDGDPWQVVEKAVQATGSEAFFDAAGVLVVRAEPGLAATGTDHLTVGETGSITGYEIGHEAAYSGVHLVYKAGTTTRVGRWYDTRPTSPTAVARIGRAVLRDEAKDTNILPTQAAADQAAAALARRAAGRGRRAVIRHIPRPWIEPGDTISVTLSGGPTELQLVESVEIPIGPGVQVTTLRNTNYTTEAAA